MTYVSAVMVEKGITVLSDGRKMKDEKIVSDECPKFVYDGELAICWFGTVEDDVIKQLGEFVSNERTLAKYYSVLDMLFDKVESSSYMICNSRYMSIEIISKSYEKKYKKIELSECGEVVASLGGSLDQKFCDKITVDFYKDVQWSNDLDYNLKEQEKNGKY